jgi:hypothetical protein
MKSFVQLGLPPEVTGGVVDTGIYTKRRQFRVVGAAKANDPTRTPMTIITPGHTPLDALISVAVGEGAGVDRIITDEETEAEFGPAQPKKIAGKPRQALAAPAVEAASLQALLATVLGDTPTLIAATATAGEYYGKTVGTCPREDAHLQQLLPHRGRGLAGVVQVPRVPVRGGARVHRGAEREKRGRRRKQLMRAGPVEGGGLSL